MCINALMKALIRAFKIAVVPAERPASQTRDARAGTHAAACRGRDGSRLFAPAACLRRLRALGRDDTQLAVPLTKIAVIPAERPASQTQGARAGTHAAACRGRDGSRLFAPVACSRRLAPLGRDDTQFTVPPTKIAVVPAERPASPTWDARTGTHAAACRG